MAHANRRSARRAASAVPAALLALATTLFATAPPSAAQVQRLSAEAYGHFTNVSLFGGPKVPVGPDPRVVLPARGSTKPVVAVDHDGAIAQYGPARIFAGEWPEKVENAPPSGPITVSVKGTTGPGGSVTSSVDIGLYPKPLQVRCSGDPPGPGTCTAPGGFGPIPVTEGDELHSTCTANDQGATGSVRFVKAEVAHSTDPDGEPKDIQPVPDQPPVGYTQEGQITNVGDNWRIVYNEQITDPDGSLTVNAVHMFLLGPIAVGEQILGHVRCAMHPESTPGPTSRPDSGTALPATKTAASANLMPWVLGAVAVVVVAAIVMGLVGRRRGSARQAPTEAPGSS